MPISVIVPTLNEADELPRLLTFLSAVPDLEIVVSDGGSEDGTPDAAVRMGVRLVRSECGRGRQMNAGAAASHGDILFFLHADAMPAAGFEKAIRRILGSDAVAAGAFRLLIDAEGWAFRLIERGADFRSRVCSMPYGDQGFFLRRRTFERLGGFADIPLMEDADLIRRCRSLGVVVTAREGMRVSARRWRKEGWLVTTARNSLLISLFLAGVPARRLAFLYPPHRL